MITHTCLIGGSFFSVPSELDSEPAPCDPEEPFSEPVASSFEPEEPEEPDVLCAAAVVVFALAAGVGVGSTSDSGDEDSLLEAAALDSAEDVVDVGVLPAAAGSSTFSGACEEASVSLTVEPAVLPRSTPKPRNTSTSNAETGREGSLRPEGAAAGVGLCGGPGGAVAVKLPAPVASGSLCESPATRRSRPSS
jgi:hypothetical protein